MIGRNGGNLGCEAGGRGNTKPEVGEKIPGQEDEDERFGAKFVSKQKKSLIRKKRKISELSKIIKTYFWRHPTDSIFFRKCSGLLPTGWLGGRGTRL